MKRAFLPLGLLLLLLASACGEPSPAPAPTPRDPAVPPESLGVVLTDGRVVVLSSEDGEEVRALALGAETDEFAGITISPDGRWAYFVRPGAVAEREIARVLVRGGDVGIVAPGFAPAISPDGQWLASIDVDQFGTPDRLIVRQVEDGTGRRDWTLEARTGPQAFVGSASWAPDSASIAYTLHVGPIAEARLLRTEEDISLWDGPQVRPEGAGDTWPLAQFRGERGEVTVVAGCCQPNRTSWVLHAVDPATTVGETVLDLGGRTTSMSWDYSGRHLLFVRDGELYRWSGEGEPVHLASDVITAAWW